MLNKKPRFEKEKDDGDSKFFRKKACRFCNDAALYLDYKDAKALKYYLTERDKILPRRQTGLCARHQRQMTNTVKKARILSLIPFSSVQR